MPSVLCEQAVCANRNAKRPPRRFRVSFESQNENATMKTAKIFPAFVVATLSVALLPDRVLAQNGSAAQQPTKQRVQLDIGRATEEVVGKLGQLDQTLQNRPPKLPTRWESVLIGSQEVKATVTKLKALRQEIGDATRGLSEASGLMRTSLKELENKFNDLAKEAQADMDGTSGSAAMPPSLLAAVQREAAIWRNGVELCSATSEYFASALASQKENISLLDRCGPMLARLERGAEGFIELAKLGKQAEEAKNTLATFSEQLNGVLDIFEQLASTTREAVAQVGPSPAKSTSPAATVVASVTPVPPAQVQSARTAKVTHTKTPQELATLLSKVQSARTAKVMHTAYRR